MLRASGLVPAPMQPPSLRRNFSMTAFGSIAYAACQFGMLSILARFTTPVEVGRYALALAISGPVFVFANLKLRQVLATDAAGEYTFGHYLGQRILTSSTAALGIVTVVIVLGLDGPTLTTVIAVTVFKALESIIDILYGAMQRHEQMQLIARSQVWRGVGGLIVFGAVVVLARRVEVASVGLAIYTLPQIATNVRRVQRLGLGMRPSFSRGQQGRLTWLALPLGVSVSAGAVAVNMPRYFIQTYEGIAALGIFASLAYVLTMSGTIIAALAEAASPRLANLFATGKWQQFKSTLARLVACGLAVGIAGVAAAVFFGAPALRLLFGPEYAARSEVLVVLMVGAGTQYGIVFLGTAVNAIRRFTVEMPISLAALAVVTAVSVVAVPPLGLMGGALAVLAGQLCTVLCYVALLVKVILPALAGRPDSAVA